MASAKHNLVGFESEPQNSLRPAFAAGVINVFIKSPSVSGLFV
jgi:hypothetical protein